MIVKQSMYVLCALGFSCASYGLVSAQQNLPDKHPATTQKPQTKLGPKVNRGLDAGKTECMNKVNQLKATGEGWTLYLTCKAIPEDIKGAGSIVGGGQGYGIATKK